MTLNLQNDEGSIFERIGAENLRRLLWDFYGRVCRDSQLGPIFEGKIGPFPRAGWPAHIALIEGFWRAVTGGPSGYRGRPGPAHVGLGIESQHFDRWLQLWAETLPAHMGEAEAAHLLTMAGRMRINLARFAAMNSLEEAEAVPVPEKYRRDAQN